MSERKTQKVTADDLLLPNERLRILELLAKKEGMFSADISSELRLSEELVHEQLATLVEMGVLLEEKREGMVKTYRLNLAVEKVFYLKNLIDAWEDHFANL